VQKRESDPSFEESLEQLEVLVGRMEAGDIPLAELVERYEEGSRLLAVCSRRLKDAEQKIELLRQDRGGVSLENFDPDQP
jgi:exodeoxyribonuclease VII small subunit